MSSSFINPLNFIKYFQEPKYTGFFKIELLKSSFVRPYSPGVIKHHNLCRIEKLGTCCWEIYSGTHFSGAKEKLGKNHDKAPKMKRARTTRVVDC